MEVGQSKRNAYASALGVLARVRSFHADIGEQRGWNLTANLLQLRFNSTFTAFLDAPSLANLAKVLCFDGEMQELDLRFPGVRPGVHSQSQPSQGVCRRSSLEG